MITGEKLIVRPRWLDEFLKGIDIKYREDGILASLGCGIPMIKSDMLPEGVEWILYDDNNEIVAYRKGDEVYYRSEKK